MKLGERYKMVLWHGESRSVWYLVDKTAPEGEQPAIVASGTVR
jgi:hypothetical protein